MFSVYVQILWPPMIRCAPERPAILNESYAEPVLPLQFILSPDFDEQTVDGQSLQRENLIPRPRDEIFALWSRPGGGSGGKLGLSRLKQGVGFLPSL